MRQVLKLHPDSPDSAATRVAVEVSRPRRDSLLLTYVVSGAIGELRLPPPAAATRTDELWRHTCFEAFVRDAAGAAYYEFNFAPSTRWAAYRFERYRSGMRVATEVGAPRITVQSEPDRCTLAAALQVGGLSGQPGDPPRRLALAAVLEEVGGRKSYWALAHPPGKPDFHHADCFVLELAQAHPPD